MTKSRPPDHQMRYVTGDVTDPIGHGPVVIAHVVNDGGFYGAGVSGAIRNRWRICEARYRNWRMPSWALASDPHFQPGATQLVTVDTRRPIIVAQMVAQHGVRSRQNLHPIDYDALRTCLRAVTQSTLAIHAELHIPRIGCGLAGGSWEVVAPMLEEICLPHIDVVVYSLPVEETVR